LPEVVGGNILTSVCVSLCLFVNNEQGNSKMLWVDFMKFGK